jgi:hypothetical protein
MRDNKKKDEPEKTPEQEALERHVDAMMDPKLPDPTDDEPIKTPKEPEPAPAPPAIERLTIRPPKSAKAAKTAPELPAAAKKIIVSDASAKPLSIDKLDQLAESIVAEDKDEAAGKPDEKPGSKPKPAEKPEPGPEDDLADDDANAPPDKEDDAAQEEDDIAEPGIDIDDERTDEAVDDIVAHEGDVVLAVADATAAERNREAEKMTGKKSHKGLAAFFWFLVAVMAAMAIVITVLMMTGGNL